MSKSKPSDSDLKEEEKICPELSHQDVSDANASCESKSSHENGEVAAAAAAASSVCERVLVGEVGGSSGVSGIWESGGVRLRKGNSDDGSKIAVGLSDSYHYEASDEPTTESEMCTEESIEKMTSSTEGVISLSEDSSGKDTYAQAATAVYSWPVAAHSDTIDLDDSDDQMNGLMGSYREISMDEDEDGTRDEDMHADTEEEVSNLSNDSNDENDTTETDENRRPNSLNLPKPVSVDSGKCTASTSSSNVIDECKERSKSLPSDIMEGLLGDLPGTITKEGDMVSFVADDLQEKIKMASPIAKRGDIPSYSISSSTTPNLYKQALTPQLPPIDPSALAEIELQAQKISASLDNMLENLMGTLHSMSSLSVDCIECYQRAVCKTCDAMDANIKSMYQLMAKCEELGNAMRPMYRLADQIKEIKRLLDLFEPRVSSSSASTSTS